MLQGATKATGEPQTPKPAEPNEPAPPNVDRAQGTNLNSDTPPAQGGSKIAQETTQKNMVG